jgi:hypothetical protein
MGIGGKGGLRRRSSAPSVHQIKEQGATAERQAASTKQFVLLFGALSHCPCSPTRAHNLLEWALREFSGALALREEHIEGDNHELFSMPVGSPPVDRRSPN